MPILEDVLAGFNGTVLAYGQTGTGAQLSPLRAQRPVAANLNVPHAQCAELSRDRSARSGMRMRATALGWKPAAALPTRSSGALSESEAHAIVATHVGVALDNR